jgi:ABC-type branched-subunit amino acid transport system permease subunit
LRYHLVTPVSGAVVLETSQQYDEAGLRPVEKGSVPTIPEPEEWMLIATVLVLLACLLLRRRQAWPTRPA